MKNRTLRSRHIAPMVMLPLVLGACSQNRLADLPDVIVNDRPEVIHVQARIPGDYGPALPHERKIFWERTIESPRLVGDTIVGLRDGRVVKVPLADVTRVRVPKDVDWGLGWNPDRGRGGGGAGEELVVEVLFCVLTYFNLC